MLTGDDWERELQQANATTLRDIVRQQHSALMGLLTLNGAVVSAPAPQLRSQTRPFTPTTAPAPLPSTTAAHDHLHLLRSPVTSHMGAHDDSMPPPLLVRRPPAASVSISDPRSGSSSGQDECPANGPPLLHRPTLSAARPPLLRPAHEPRMHSSAIVENDMPLLRLPSRRRHEVGQAPQSFQSSRDDLSLRPRAEFAFVPPPVVSRHVPLVVGQGGRARRARRAHRRLFYPTHTAVVYTATESAPMPTPEGSPPPVATRRVVTVDSATSPIRYEAKRTVMATQTAPEQVSVAQNTCIDTCHSATQTHIARTIVESVQTEEEPVRVSASATQTSTRETGPVATLAGLHVVPGVLPPALVFDDATTSTAEGLVGVADLDGGELVCQAIAQVPFGGREEKQVQGQAIGRDPATDALLELTLVGREGDDEEEEEEEEEEDEQLAQQESVSLSRLEDRLAHLNALCRALEQPDEDDVEVHEPDGPPLLEEMDSFQLANDENDGVSVVSAQPAALSVGGSSSSSISGGGQPAVTRAPFQVVDVDVVYTHNHPTGSGEKGRNAKWLPTTARGTPTSGSPHAERRRQMHEQHTRARLSQAQHLMDGILHAHHIDMTVLPL